MMIHRSISVARRVAIVFLATIPVAIGQAGCGREQGQTGFYLILAEAQDAEGLPKPSTDQQIARYDQKYLREVESQSPRYLLLRKKPDIAFTLAKPPESTRDSRGHTVLAMELTRETGTNLERFTRSNLGKKVAFAIEGEVVTIHKVRSVISGNQFVLSRCTDNACEYIRARLTQ